MLRLISVSIGALLSGFRSRRELILENLALRQQLATLVQKRRPLIRPADRAFWMVLRRFWSRWASAIVIVKPETVIGGGCPGRRGAVVAQASDGRCALLFEGWRARTVGVLPESTVS